MRNAVNRGRVYLEDIIDIDPIVRVSEELMDRCRNAFEPTDHDFIARDRVHDSFYL